jgi:hypothetical protein
VRVAFYLVLGETQFLKGVKVHEVKVTAPIHEGLSELGSPDQRVNDEGMLSEWSIWSKVIRDSDQRRYSGTAMLTELTTLPVSLSLWCDSWGAGQP